MARTRSYVQDSRYYGYLEPLPPAHPLPPQNGTFIDFLHDIVIGITNLDPRLVRPRWQREPPPIPSLDLTWLAMGITQFNADWVPSVRHVDDGHAGYDAFQRTETSNLLVSGYGPNCQYVMSLLRDGLFIDQNLSVLRRNAVAVVEVGPMQHVPELFREQWQDRIDTNITIRREIRRDYPVLHLLRSRGPIYENPTGTTRVVETEFDTANVTEAEAPLPPTQRILLTGPNQVLGSGTGPNHMLGLGL
jgi:hypothetical protein